MTKFSIAPFDWRDFLVCSLATVAAIVGIATFMLAVVKLVFPEIG